MADDRPVVYIFHGDDSYAIQKVITSMVAKLGDPSIADLNFTRLDGRTAPDDDLRSAALSMPFLAERRIVVLSNPLARISRKEDEGGESQSSSANKAAREKFLSFLGGLPPSTALVLVIDDGLVRRKGQLEWEILTEGHWLIKWARAHEKYAHIQEFRLPSLGEMPGWIKKAAEAQKGAFSPPAARILADYIGTDTQVAVQEITKLLTYVNFERPVEEDDVMRLTAQIPQVNVFAMVDALSERNARRAIQTLHDLLEESDPLELFGMIVRQFRLLLQVREILDEGGGLSQIQAEVREQKGQLVQSFVAQKLAEQARHFSMERLEAVYRHLLELDLAMKTSQMTFELAMDTLVAELTQ
jgi:DNA polymerase-3 subunit delta